MTISLEDQAELDALEIRLKQILPEEYQETYDEVQPVSMGSASLKYLRNGLVAWNDIWETFCDLAMAGGPPHKGTFLEPGAPADIEAQPDQYQQVVDEICRGVTMVSGLEASPSSTPGWVRVECESDGMADWLVRAIVMENVSAHREGCTIELPAGPRYRVEKEIKNVVTVIAKTCHYWLEHMLPAQQREIAELFQRMADHSPLVQHTAGGHETLRDKMAASVQQGTKLQPAKQKYSEWLGLECPDVHAAIWMMRALVVSNILARREGTVLLVPVNPAIDPGGEIVVRGVIRIYSFAVSRSIL